MDFKDPQQLATWLTHHHVDIAQWGKGTAKSVVDLWNELSCGDSKLDENPIVRRVSVASLLVYQGNWQLIEAVQTFTDGRQRFPNRAPSEKFKAGESPEDAALRCLREELGVTSSNIVTQPSLLSTKSVLSNSPSYPTLPSEFTFYTFRVEVQGLPVRDSHRMEARRDAHDIASCPAVEGPVRVDFTTHNQADLDPVRTIGWTWIRSQETPS